MEERKWEVENAKSSPVIIECQFYYHFFLLVRPTSILMAYDAAHAFNIFPRVEENFALKEALWFYTIEMFPAYFVEVD